MFRCCTALLAALLVLSTAQANISVVPFHADGGKKADPAESRQRIIEQLKADYDKLLDRLSADDPGAEARRNQQRILDGLDELLKQKDPNPNQNANNPPKGSSEPKPMPTVGEPKAMPSPAVQKQPSQAEPKPIAQAPPVAGIGRTPPSTPEELRKEVKTSGYWPPLPPRHRAEMDAFGRERFMPNYQELLREYYRNLARSSRSQDE